MNPYRLIVKQSLERGDLTREDLLELLAEKNQVEELSEKQKRINYYAERMNK